MTDQDDLFTLHRDDLAEYRIFIRAGSPGPVTYASHELLEYLSRILNVPRVAIEEADIPELVVAVAPRERLGPGLSEATAAVSQCGEDGFAYTVAANGVAIAGFNPRGVLYGVYAFLHELGCRWLTPGDDGEVIPQRVQIALRQGERSSTPVFRRRGFGEDTRAVPRDNPEWRDDLIADSIRFADWMAKNRMNHFTTRPDVLATIKPELDAQGIVSLHGGGHNIPRLLPRELFADHPEYFRMDDAGVRQPDGNLCVSNPVAVRIVVENAIAEVRRHAPMELFGVQGEDTWSGGWCECNQCRSLSSIQQNMVLCRAVAEGLRRAGLGDTRVSFAAYRDTLQPRIDRAELPEGLFVRYAPRERSYGVPLNSPASDRNRWYARNLERWAKILSPDSLAITEYYTDSVLYSSFPVPLMSVIARDLKYYAEIGATAWIRVLFMSRYCWWAYPLNFYAVARLSWNVDEPIEDIVADFCHHRYGAAAATMVAFFHRFERAMSHVATYGDIYGPPETFDPLIEQLMVDVETALHLLEESIELVERALHEAEDDLVRDRIRREELAVRFAANEVAALNHQIRGQYWFARSSGNEPRFVFETEHKRGFAKAAAELEKAIEIYQQGTEMLVSHPYAPHSAWLDSGLGLHRRKNYFLEQLERKVQQCRDMAHV